MTVEFVTYPSATYPTVSIAEASNFIEFIDPCLSPFQFVTGGSLINPASDKFSGDSLVFTVNEHFIYPLRCDVSYACSLVQRTDLSATTLGCADFKDFDGIIDL